MSWRAERVYDPLTSRCPFIDRSEELRSSPSRLLSLQIYVFSSESPRISRFFAQTSHVFSHFWLVLREIRLDFLEVLVILEVLVLLVSLGLLVFLEFLAQPR